MYLLKKISLIFIALSFLFVTACDVGTDVITDANDEEESIVDLTTSDDDFSQLAEALETAGLFETLESEGPYTVFAPTNDAFEALPEDTLENLSQEQLFELLTYHILEFDLFTSEIEPERIVTAFSEEEVFITNDEGELIEVNRTATISEADIQAENGVIHAVNYVLFPDGFGDITQNIDKRFFLTGLSELLAEYALDETLQDTAETYTVFAPDNDALEDASGQFEAMDPEEIEQVLRYHIIPNRLLTSDFEEEQELETLQGDTLTVTLEDGEIRINGLASITSANIDGQNGVVHVIDQIVMP